MTPRCRRALGLAILLLRGCASGFMKGEPPEVLVTTVTPLEATLFEQRLQVDLRIRNPNDFDFHVTGLDCKWNLNGKRLARWLGNKEFTVPRLSDAIVTVQTSTSTLDLVRQLVSLSETQGVAYDISGVLHRDDGRLPFDNSSTLLGQECLSGVQAFPITHEPGQRFTMAGSSATGAFSVCSYNDRASGIQSGQ